MLPPKTDPRWKQAVLGSEPLQLKALATKMVMTRVRLMGARRDDKSLSDAIDTVYEYFAKNAETTGDDLAAVLSAKGVTR